MELSRRGGFSGFALKVLAVAFMLCDHVGYFIIRRGLFAPWTSPAGFLSFSDAPAYVQTANQVYRVLDVLGHAAFPLFCFLLAEGVAHTRSRKRYLLTLLAFALVTEPIYDWTHYGVLWSWQLQNVLFTLTVCCAELCALDWVRERFSAETRKRRWLLALTVIFAGALAFLVRGEYVFLGTTAAALFHLLREKGTWRLAGLLALLPASPWVLLAAPLLLLYNGRRGKRGWKYAFYVFYPAHFPVLMWIGTLCAKKF